MAGFTNMASLFLPTVQGMGVATNVLGFADKLTGAAQDDQRAALQRQQDLALRQLQQLQGDEMTRAGENAAQERARIALDAQVAEETRRAALKRAVARQRATFGASGIDMSGGGSGQAVLLGLYDESETERARREELDSLRYGAIDQEIAQIGRRNVLEHTQLAQQHQIQQSLAGYGKGKQTLLGRFFDSF